MSNQWTQAAIIRLPNCPGKSLFIWARMIYILLLVPIVLLKLQASRKHVLISCKLSKCFDFLTVDILFCFSGTFGQAVLWPSLPNWAINIEEMVTA